MIFGVVSTNAAPHLPQVTQLKYLFWAPAIAAVVIVVGSIAWYYLEPSVEAWLEKHLRKLRREDRTKK